MILIPQLCADWLTDSIALLSVLQPKLSVLHLFAEVLDFLAKS